MSVFDDSLLDAALSPAELSVLEAMLAALGCDKSLCMEDELEVVLLTMPPVAASPSEALLSGMTWGRFKMLPSMGLEPENCPPKLNSSAKIS